jgi:hypothetical protein
MNRDELKTHFTLQIKLRELCDAAGIERPLSKRELQIGLLALQAEPPEEKDEHPVTDLARAI